MGTDKPDDVAGLHFPGCSGAAVDFLLKNRWIAAIAIDTASIDPGNSKEFPAHRLWLSAQQARLRELALRRKAAGRRRDDILHPHEDRLGEPEARPGSLRYCRAAYMVAVSK